MKYESSRGGSRDSSFESVLFSGYAPDGGLYVPASVPRLSVDQLRVCITIVFVGQSTLNQTYGQVRSYGQKDKDGPIDRRGQTH